MPNWCEGSLKVRGKILNLKDFVLHALNPSLSWERTLNPFLSGVKMILRFGLTKLKDWDWDCPCPNLGG